MPGLPSGSSSCAETRPVPGPPPTLGVCGTASALLTRTLSRAHIRAHTDGRAHGPCACSLSAQRRALKGRPLHFPPFRLTSCVAERLQKVPRLGWPRSILWKGCFQSEARRGPRGQQDHHHVCAHVALFSARTHPSPCTPAHLLPSQVLDAFMQTRAVAHTRLCRWPLGCGSQTGMVPGASPAGRMGRQRS